MKFGIATPNFGKFADPETISERTLSAEKLGYDSVWVSDHIVVPKSHRVFGDVFYEPLTTLSFLAHKTSKISLGTSVIVLPYRNPLVLAKQISTIDILSNGRLILGIGVGWLKDEFDALGISYKDRGNDTNESIEIIKELLTNETNSYQGRKYKFSNIRFFPKTLQKPHPPIWVGGNGRRGMERAVEHGSGWHAVGLTPRQIEKKVNYINEILNKKKLSEKNFVISLRKNLQITDRKIRNTDETLRGNKDKIINGLIEYKKSGVSHMVFHILGGNLDKIFKTMEIFSNEIKNEILNC